MKVRILIPVVESNFSLSTGDVTDASPATAARLIAAGIAEAIEDAEQVETATLDEEPAETATVKTTKPRRKAVSQ